MDDEEILRTIISLTQQVDDGGKRVYTWRQIGEMAGGISGNAAKGRYVRWLKRNGSRRPQVEIEGVLASDYEPDPEQAWKVAIDGQKRRFELQERKAVGQTIAVADIPCGIVILSDLHLGNPGTDYITIKRDAELIRDTPGVYCGFNGDGVDNWIVKKLAHLQRGQVLTLDAEWALFFDWLGMIRDKLLWVVSGNHENWTRTIAGIDRVQDRLKDVKVLYDPEQIIFDLVVGDVTWRIKTRHSWKGSSVFNATHGIEVGWERGGNEFDIGIGSHTHICTVNRPFVRQQQTIHAILTGTYKTYDEFGRQKGLAPPQDRGSGMMLFDGDGNMDFYSDLERGIRVLGLLRNDT